MKLKLYYIIGLFFSITSYGQNYGSFASGIKINNTIYNTTASGAVNQINPSPGAQFFDGLNLGNFGQNGSCAKITGAELKTFKEINANVCTAAVKWRVYFTGSPSGAFNTINLSTVSDCDLVTNTFNDGFGPCTIRDQKWKNYATNQSFTDGLLPGNYTLEIFYINTGSNFNPVGCLETYFTDNSGNNFKANFTITNPNCAPTASPTILCEGDTLNLMSNPSNGVSPYTYSWTGPNGYTSASANPTIVTTVNNSGVYSLIVTDSCGSNSSLQSTNAVTVNPKITPTFDALLPYICKDGTPPVLSTISSNFINGSWLPPTVSNTATGSYIFTPDNGECANSISVLITVINNVQPTFPSLPSSICENGPKPNLAGISNNGIYGVWTPSTVNNQVAGNHTYTFQPNVGQCALTKTVTINVTPNVTPTFNLPNFVCINGAVPNLPTSSTNTPPISGTWFPTTVSNSTSGTYTFTPSNGICAVPYNLFITVRPILTPTFDPIANVCKDKVAGALPLQSTNTPPITGTWFPALIDTSVSGTFPYTFTPDASFCANSVTVNVTIDEPIVTTVDPVANICKNGNAPILNGNSTNIPAISGTWSPPAIDTSVEGVFQYTFTPNSQFCATIVSINIVIDPQIVPTFTQIAPICQGTTAPALPNPSNNTPAISGTWSPATIDTSASGSFIYYFTPDSNQCAILAQMTIVIDSKVNTTFTNLGSFCQNSVTPALPLMSTNTPQISGTWLPANINTSIAGTFTYTFTPASGICATSYPMIITIDAPTPTIFNSIPLKICYNSVAPLLSNLSDNFIAGTWFPALVNNTTTGSYTFTPNSGICATAKTFIIIVIPELFADVKNECKDASYLLSVVALNNSFDLNNATYLWRDELGGIIPNSNSSVLNVTNYTETTTRIENFPLNYTVTISTLDGCLINQVKTIDTIYCQIQKGISPNGDGLNDYFDLSQMDVKNLEIFNRYGMKVYSKSGYKKEWNGQTDGGETLPDGTYFYSVEFITNDIKTGWIYINKENK